MGMKLYQILIFSRFNHYNKIKLYEKWFTEINKINICMSDKLILFKFC